MHFDVKFHARGTLFCALVGITVAASGCHTPERKIPQKSETLAELRVIRRGVHVTEEGRSERDPFPRERLTESEVVKLDEGALAWIRRDGGSTLLIKGPAKLTSKRDTLEVEQGSVFAESPEGIVTTVSTPEGSVSLSDVRASLEVSPEKARVYVLTGEVRTKTGAVAKAGEELSIDKSGASVAPLTAWDDWTGGLATTDRTAEPAPFGVGTVGARTPGASGAPREPLTIQRLDVHVTVTGDFATTEVDETFFNPISTTVEGIYRFRAPEGANLERFGVDRAGSVAWGFVKEKKAAAAQYSKNVYQGSTEDPALLEWKAPGQYEARLYPIGPGATRRVVVRYTEWLGRAGSNGERRLYVYPMAAEGSEASLPHIEEFNADVDLTQASAGLVRAGMDATRDGDVLTVRRHDFVPRADLAVEMFDAEDDGSKDPAKHFRKPGEVPIYRAAHQLDEAMVPPNEDPQPKKGTEEADYVLVPVTIADLPKRTGGLDLEIVVDSSAATDTESLSLARATAKSLMAHLGKDDRVAVFTGDDELRPVLAPADKKADVFRPADAAGKTEILEALARIRQGGATDLGRMMSEAIAKLPQDRASAIVYIGDGDPTVGELNLTDMRARLAKAPHPARVFALGIGENANMGLLAGIASGGFAEPVADEHAAALSALHVLEVAERAVDLGVTVDLGPNVERVYPRDTSAITEGETILVVGRITGKKLPDELVAKGSAGEKKIALTAGALDDRGDLRRRWAMGRLDQLMAEGAGPAALADLGVRQGIITPVTSIYVPTLNEMTPKQRDALREEKERQVAEQKKRVELRATLSDGREHDEKPHEAADQDKSKADSNKEGGTGTRAKGEEGVMGAPTAATKQTSKSVGQNEPSAPTGAWGRDDSLAPAATAAASSAPATVPEPEPGARDFGMVGLSGEGEGGGGRGEGFGNGSGRLSGAHRDQPGKGAEAPGPVGHAPAGGAAPPAEGQPGVVATSPVAKPPPPPDANDPLSANGNAWGDGTAPKYHEGKKNGEDAKTLEPPKDSSELANSRMDQAGEHLKKTATNLTINVNVPQPLVVLIVDDPGRRERQCGDAARLPFEERMSLWRERLQKSGSTPQGARMIYLRALADCELPTARERTALLLLMLDFIPNTFHRVELYRLMATDMGAADILYRGILARTTTPAAMRELSQALGLVTVDPSVLEKALKDAKTPEERVAKLHALFSQFPNDLGLALVLLDALEDANDAAGARAFADELRTRPDAEARVRTSVGELYLRLAAHDADDDQKERDAEEARRAFGEIVEFSPDDPVARRRLGDLFRAHGFYEDATRQYETLAKLTPDDPSVALLLAACADGLGKIEEAVKWTEKGGSAGSPDAAQGPFVTARAFAATYIAWAKLEAKQAGNTKDLDALSARLARVLSSAGTAPVKGQIRVSLTWSHPELHPSLWSNALGSPMPAPEGDVTLGIAQVMMPDRGGGFVEVRIDPQDLDRAARLGAKARLTAIFHENADAEVIVTKDVQFTRGGPSTIRMSVEGGKLEESGAAK